MNEETPFSETDRPPLTGGNGLRTLLLGLFLIPWSSFWGMWTMIFGVLRQSHITSWGLSIWARGILSLAGIHIQFSQRAVLPVSEHYIFLSNHQSALDIPILLLACRKAGQGVRFMAKESLFKIPFLGWGMALNGFIPIQRENARQAAEVFKGVVESRKNLAYSYLIFPEGTRSEDGRLQPLKKGTIALALRLELPIVPVSIVDACRANPKAQLRVRSGTVRVIFGVPIVPPQDPNRTQRDALLRQVQDAINAALPPEQQIPLLAAPVEQTKPD